MSADVKTRLSSPSHDQGDRTRNRPRLATVLRHRASRATRGCGCSSDLGQGSTFKVYLPWARESLRRAPRPRAPPRWPGTENILLWSTRPPVRALRRACAARAGLPVSVAATGRKRSRCSSRRGSGSPPRHRHRDAGHARHRARGEARAAKRIGRVLVRDRYTDRTVDDLHPDDGICQAVSRPTVRLLRAVRDLLDV